jgi:hypothetical protein
MALVIHVYIRDVLDDVLAVPTKVMVANNQHGKEFDTLLQKTYRLLFGAGYAWPGHCDLPSGGQSEAVVGEVQRPGIKQTRSQSSFVW